MNKSLSAARRRAAAKLESCGLVHKKRFNNIITRRSNDFVVTKRHWLGKQFKRRPAYRACREEHDLSVKRQNICLSWLGDYVVDEFGYKLKSNESIRWNTAPDDVDLKYWDEDQLIKDWNANYVPRLRSMRQLLRRRKMTARDPATINRLRRDVGLFSEIVGRQ